MEELNQVIKYNYSYTYKFESDFVHETSRKWIQETWKLGWIYYCVGAYMVFIFVGQYLMQNRPKFELRRTLCLWNIVLAIFSFMGAYRIIPEFLHMLTQHGFSVSVCDASFIEQKAFGFWTYMFVLSKVPELGDTVFIVLRKQRLIFLHWYHHVTVLLYSWFSLTEYSSTARWFMAMNYSIHSIMYSYFALKACGYAPPRQVAMVITILQILQMIVGSIVNFKAYQLLQQGVKCNVSLFNVKLSLAVYLSYFVLFAKLFYNAYISTKKTVNLSTAEISVPKSKLH